MVNNALQAWEKIVFKDALHQLNPHSKCLFIPVNLVLQNGRGMKAFGCFQHAQTVLKVTCQSRHGSNKLHQLFWILLRVQFHQGSVHILGK